MTWRDRWRPLVSTVLERTAGQPERAIRAALAEAYPGCRMGWAYACWLDEVRRQRGTKRPTKARKGTPKRAQQEAEERTGDLFAEVSS